MNIYSEEVLFKDRLEAARELISYLQDYTSRKDVVIMAIPRGGVPVGDEIARNLQAPLDLVLIKKLGHPHNPEYAIGTVGPEARSIYIPGIPDDYIEEETDRIRRLLTERKQKYLGNRNRISVEDKTVLLVDDGIATGRTMAAAADLMRQQGAREVVIAVPVSAPDAVTYLEKHADKVICLAQPANFFAISQFYRHFEQTSDEEVAKIMNGK